MAPKKIYHKSTSSSVQGRRKYRDDETDTDEGIPLASKTKRFANRGWGSAKSTFDEPKPSTSSRRAASLPNFKMPATKSEVVDSFQRGVCSPRGCESPSNLIDDASDSGTETPVTESLDLSMVVIETPTSGPKTTVPLSICQSRNLSNPRTKRSLFDHSMESANHKCSLVTKTDHVQDQHIVSSQSPKFMKRPNLGLEYLDQGANDIEKIPESPMSESTFAITESSGTPTEDIEESPLRSPWCRSHTSTSSTVELEDKSDDDYSVHDDVDRISTNTSSPQPSNFKIFGTQWLLAQQTPKKDDEAGTVAEVVPPPPPIDSARKPSRFIKGGLAEQLEHVLLEERAEKAFREQNPSPSCKRLTVRVTNVLTLEQHLLVDCVEVADPAEEEELGATSILATNRLSPNLPPGDTLALMLSLAATKRWAIWVGSLLHLKPPWQMLHVPVLAKSFILCPAVIDAGLPHPGPALPGGPIQEYSWGCPCVLDCSINPKACPAKDVKNNPGVTYLQRIMDVSVHSESGASSVDPRY